MRSHTRISYRSRRSDIKSFELVKGYLSQVKAVINEQLSDCTEPVQRLLGCVNMEDGKMLRPGLVLLCGSAVGDICEEHIKVAAIIELIHNATLLHDDVIDEGTKRRDTATVNILWGNEPAILLGDFLLSRAFGLCVGLDVRSMRIIADTASRLCNGELRQSLERSNPLLTEPEYIEIIKDKSASLFISSCRLGGILGGGTDEQIGSLSDYGRDIGIAFQIMDDLLDISGDEARAGKSLGRDFAKRRLTLPVIHLLTKADESQRRVIAALTAEGADRNFQLKDMLKQSGSLRYARERAEFFTERAIKALCKVEQNGSKGALVETARHIGGLAGDFEL